MARTTTLAKAKEAGAKYLTKTDIFAKDDVTFLEHEVPQWGGTLLFRSLTGNEAIEFGQRLNDMDAKQEAVIDLFATSVVDEEGNKIFTPSDMRKLREKSWAVFLKAQNVLLEFNGYTDAARVKAKND